MKTLFSITLFLSLITISFAQKTTIRDNFNINLNPENELELNFKNEIIEGLKNLNESEKNELKIVFISPIADLKHKQQYTFNVAVVYNLATTEEGVLNIGNNSDVRPDSFRLIDGAEKIISSGKGYHIFKITTEVFDLSKKGKPFFIATNLSEYPHSQRWRPLDSDRFVLKIY